MRSPCLVSAVGARAARAPPPTTIRSECRTSKRRISSSSTSIRWAISCRTRCARSPTRSSGSAGCSAGCPSESTIVLLKDLVGLRQRPPPLAAPHSRLVFDIAPLSHAFETFPASERMYLADEPRDGPHRARRHGVRRRIDAGAASSSARSTPQSAEPRNAALQLPHDPALHGPALVHRGQSRSSWRRGWAAASGARRAATTRWCSGRWCATTRTSTIRSVSYRAAPRSISRSARMPISTARASSPTSRTPIRRRRSSPGSGATTDSKRYYSDQFEHVFGIPLGAGVAGVDRLRARIPAEESRGSAQVSDYAAPRPGRERGRLDLAHVLRRGERHDLRRLPLSRASSSTSAR